MSSLVVLPEVPTPSRIPASATNDSGSVYYEFEHKRLVFGGSLERSTYGEGIVASGSGGRAEGTREQGDVVCLVLGDLYEPSANPIWETGLFEGVGVVLCDSARAGGYR